ncbi:hypothetical protein RvY_01875 [Ramazzottius varieornatus]|uniref:Uncharacterized protein n=1 Tax=Ramazzottius varieornatus TaxID=947166 RepID=A0A1D1UHX1_RAMVA|nr:hypothetical protein RvY_01875 [Ramazzottius varieornatus]
MDPTKVKDSGGALFKNYSEWLPVYDFLIYTKREDALYRNASATSTLERPLGDLPLTAEPTREINLPDMEDADQIDRQGLDSELRGLDADE